MLLIQKLLYTELRNFENAIWNIELNLAKKKLYSKCLKIAYFFEKLNKGGHFWKPEFVQIWMTFPSIGK